jgi:hypothetical protein
MSRILYRLAVAVSFLIFTAAIVAAQDFKKSYSLGAGGEISIRSVSGNVVVTGYDGETVIVTAIKEGRDRDLIDVEDSSSGNRVDVRARYPRNCNCNASINFEVQVPRSVKYDFDELSSASGDIKVSNVTGKVRAESASGNVSVKNINGSVKASSASGDVRVRDIIGIANARSASGDVDVNIISLEGGGDMEFSSASGNVTVKAPSNLDADIDMSTSSGSVTTEFPIQVSKRDHGPSQSARGRLGSGSRHLRLSSASGDVKLLSSSTQQ